MTTVEWNEGKVRFIDQTCLPAEEVYVETDDYRVVAEAIRSLKIRGAPAIGVAAAFAILLAVGKRHFTTGQEMLEEVDHAVEVLSATRPTAVNLFSALRRMQRTVEGGENTGVPELFLRLAVEATVIYREDVESCRNIGSIGADLIPPGSSVLTHCNAGALATAGEGTALSVITTAARQGKIVRVYAGETRPHFQGARLTAWELLRQGIETVLITDSAVGSVLQQGRVQVVIVGADRIAANGDTANKIGTYPIAVLAARHRVPFYVAAPTSTFDVTMPDGAHIPIEERQPAEVTDIAGHRIAAEGVKVYAPVFDITPASLVNAIITEKGILHPPYPRSIAALFEQPAEEPKTP